MEKDRIVEILNLIKIKLNDRAFYSRSICNSLTHLKINSLITSDERDFIKNLLQENKPTKTNQYKSFTLNVFWNDFNQPIDNSYWWQENVGFIRIEYLDAVIHNIK